jgi:hypothetical protein
MNEYTLYKDSNVGSRLLFVASDYWCGQARGAVVYHDVSFDLDFAIRLKTPLPKVTINTSFAFSIPSRTMEAFS